MSILQLPHDQPAAVLIDWHATLVDTHDAMYHAVDDVLPRLKELGLWDRLLKPGESKTIEDAKLVKYVREHNKLHPKITAQRKISRTDIFEVLFGADGDASGKSRAPISSKCCSAPTATPSVVFITPLMTATKSMWTRFTRWKKTSVFSWSGCASPACRWR